VTTKRGLGAVFLLRSGTERDVLCLGILVAPSNNHRIDLDEFATREFLFSPTLKLGLQLCYGSGTRII
jgi:hypothetical protein